MWQLATFLDVISEVPVVLVVHRRGRISAEESMQSSVRRGYIYMQKRYRHAMKQYDTVFHDKQSYLHIKATYTLLFY